MDPLSITSGVIAIEGAAVVVFKCAGKFYKIARKAGVIGEEIEFFAAHIDTFGTIVSSAHLAIREHIAKYGERSDMLQHIHQDGVLDNLALMSNHLMNGLKDVEPAIKDRNKGLSFFGRVLWVWKHSERERLCIWMERVKLTFVMIMHEIRHEALQERIAIQDTLLQGLFTLERELREVRKQMKRHIKKQLVWNDRYQISSHHKIQQFGEDQGLVLDEVEKVVLNLGKRMISQRPSSSTSDVSASDTNLFSDYSSDNAIQSNVSPPFATHSLGSPIHGLPPPLPPSHSLGRNSALYSSATSSSEESFETEWGSSNIQPSNHVLYLNTALNSQAITGYINSTATVAMLNMEFSHNVISEQQAVQLHLHVEYYDEEKEDMLIEYAGGNGNIKQLVLGEVKFDWNVGQDWNLRPLTVTCLVCEYVPFRLIFGQSFLNKRQHYWGE